MFLKASLDSILNVVIDLEGLCVMKKEQGITGTSISSFVALKYNCGRKLVLRNMVFSFYHLLSSFLVILSSWGISSCPHAVNLASQRPQSPLAETTHNLRRAKKEGEGRGERGAGRSLI